jgi:L-threonylcarbamoyladenylate synthase
MRVLRCDHGAWDAADLRTAVAWIEGGGVVAYPTDTFYGLGADVRSDLAVAAIFDLKGRDERAPLPLIAASLAQVEAFCGPLGPLASRLANRFWPGPLALICDAPAGISPSVHAGTGTIAVRVPAQAMARALADAWGRPITATSANRSGDPPASSLAALGSLADDSRLLVIDAGPTAGGAPSTIVDARGAAPTVVREGAVPWERVLRSLQI